MQITRNAGDTTSRSNTERKSKGKNKWGCVCVSSPQVTTANGVIICSASPSVRCSWNNISVVSCWRGRWTLWLCLSFWWADLSVDTEKMETSATNDRSARDVLDKSLYLLMLSLITSSVSSMNRSDDVAAVRGNTEVVPCVQLLIQQLPSSRLTLFLATSGRLMWHMNIVSLIRHHGAVFREKFWVVWRHPVLFLDFPAGFESHRAASSSEEWRETLWFSHPRRYTKQKQVTLMLTWLLTGRTEPS